MADVEKHAIAVARNGGAALALGEWVCFIDADSRIHSKSFNAIDELSNKKNIIVGATDVKPDRMSFSIFHMGVRASGYLSNAG